MKVAELKSFSKAAKAMDISRPSLTRVIGELEEETGVAIFLRNTRSVAVTPAGEALLTEGRIL